MEESALVIWGTTGTTPSTPYCSITSTFSVSRNYEKREEQPPVRDVCDNHHKCEHAIGRNVTSAA
jgi:hypothetical protein